MSSFHKISELVTIKLLFPRKCVKNEEFTIQGDGLESRSFCYISDAIDALMIFLNNDEITSPEKKLEEISKEITYEEWIKENKLRDFLKK